MNNTKHILHIAPTPFFSDRGCHIRIEGEVRCLQQLGFQNTVCTYHHGRDVSSVTTKRIKTIAAYTDTKAGPSKYKLLADWRLLCLVFRHYRVLKPVALHAHLHEGLLIGFIIKSLFFWRRTPLIGDMQGSLVGELESHGVFKQRTYFKWPLTLFEKALYWCATHVVCSNNHSRNKLVNEFGINESKVSLSQDGADPAPKITEQVTTALVEKYQIDTNKKIVIYTGALLNAKGLTELKQIIEGCAANKDKLHFLIVGYPTENLASFLQEKKLSDLCTLTGQINFDQLPAHLSLADIAIDPKKTDAGEGSGKMLNYLAAGLPVVAFESINNKHFLPTTTNLAISNQEFSQQLIELADNSNKRLADAAANLKQFEEHYSWDVTRHQLQDIYQRLRI